MSHRLATLNEPGHVASGNAGPLLDPPTGGWHKQPFHFRRTDGQPFAFAGLWERWHGGDGEPAKAVETCTI